MWTAIFVLCLTTVYGAKLQNENLEAVSSTVNRNEVQDSVRHTSFIGVTAFTQSDEDYPFNQTLLFEGTIINEGDAYRPLISWFICPVDGIYYVEIGIKASDGSFVQLQVMRGTEYILYMQSDSPDNDWNTDTNSGIVRCNQGDNIYLRSWSGCNVYGEAGIPYSTFTVILMQQDSPELHESFIGFTAWKASDQSYSDGDLIQFEQVLFNDNEYYDPGSSEFKCPVSGVYYVVVHFRVAEEGALRVGLSNGTNIILHADMSTGNSDNRFTTVSNSRLVSCAEGGSLSVVATGTGEVSGFTEDQVTTFSAMLMAPDAPSKRHESFIGFTAYKSSNQEYDERDTIQFDQVLLNEGDAYQPLLSRFTCPVLGIYLISLNAQRASGSLYLIIERDTTLIFKLEDNGPLNSGNTVSNSVLTRCVPGEHISVKASEPGMIAGDSEEIVTTFTVMLMYEYPQIPDFMNEF